MTVKNDVGETVKAGCVILNDQRQILLVSKKTRVSWGLPKGHRESGETVQEAAVREVMEETGYEVEVVKQLPVFSYFNKLSSEPNQINIFVARIREQVGPAEEPTQWFSFDEAEKVLQPNLVEFLKLQHVLE